MADVELREEALPQREGEEEEERDTLAVAQLRRLRAVELVQLGRRLLLLEADLPLHLVRLRRVDLPMHHCPLCCHRLVVEAQEEEAGRHPQHLRVASFRRLPQRMRLLLLLLLLAMLLRLLERVSL